MNTIKIFLFSISLLSFFSTFTCSNGQKKTEKQKWKTIEIGRTVSKVDKAIWSIYQDKKSNYWFGSKENGVYYYNGQQIKQITVDDGLINNEVRGFQEDSLGNVYIETERGISKFDGHSFKTLQIANPDSPSTDWLLEPNDLWFRIGFNANGVYRFDGELVHYLKLPKSPQEDILYSTESNNHGLKPYGIYTIYKDRNGYMWFGTSHLGLCRFDGKKISWHYEEQLQTTPSGGSFGTRAIFEDKEGKFWINNTRFRYNIQPNSSTNIDFHKEVGVGYKNENKQLEFPFFLSIAEDNKGNLWMVTYENGVWKYNGKELIHYPIKDGSTDVLLFTIYKDNKGVLWLGSHNAGVYKFNGDSFEKFGN